MAEETVAVGDVAAEEGGARSQPRPGPMGGRSREDLTHPPQTTRSQGSAGFCRVSDLEG